MKKIVFVHRGPHRLHMNWMRSVDAQFYFFNPEIFSTKLKDGRNQPKIKNTFVLQLLALLRAFTIPKADIYVIEGISCLLPALFRRGKIILINSDPFFQVLEKQNILFRKIYLAYLKRVDVIISTSNMIKKMSEKYTAVPNVVVYPYCEDRYFQEKAEIDGKNICTSGRLSRSKGTDILLDEFKKNPSGKLYLFGTTDGINADEKNVVCTGWVDDLEKKLKKCSLYISNSRFDAFGIGILESMAEGIPVLVSKNCGIAEILPKELIFEDSEFNEKFSKLRNTTAQKKYGKICRRISLGHTKKKSINEFRKALQKLST